MIKVVPQPETPTHDHQLKLLFFEDTKSVVANLCDLDGYLVMAMGQKLYVRALEQDEVLLAVGFLDVGVHVTSLQSLKNFLLIGDALQSVTLVAFQVSRLRCPIWTRLTQIYLAGRSVQTCPAREGLPTESNVECQLPRQRWTRLLRHR